MIDPYPDLRRATKDGVAPIPFDSSPSPARNFFAGLSLEHACQIAHGHRDEVVAPAGSLALFDSLTENVGRRFEGEVLDTVAQTRACRLLLAEYERRLPTVDSVPDASERVWMELQKAPL